MTNIFAQDQFGNKWGPLDPKAIKRSLLESTHRKSAAPMYVDLKSGGSKKVGYVVSPPKGENENELWCYLIKETLEPFEF